VFPANLLPPAQNLTDLWTQSTKKMWYADPDHVSPSETIIYDQVLHSSSSDFDFDLGNICFTPSRWTKLVRQYLPVSPTLQFVQRAAQIARGESKPGAICGLSARTTHSHYGGCILGFTFRGLRTERPVLTMHSRVSYAGYMAALDLALAHKLAQEIGLQSDLTPENIAFRWVVDSLQFHAIRTLPYLLTRRWFHSDIRDNVLAATSPAIKNAVAALRTLRASSPSWGPTRRVAAILRKHKQGCPRRSFPLESLTLDCLCKVS
jgi:hypothetical protein